ncbi:hypothetical protein P167DRAFT_250879 [Morchella conica CCBAS932]|uniref:Uncharacterized protein n=1 Tax=Morchella conica CCBAS932 TaxID=1392247 RepID=A0A3N4KJ97_9PEZI|nr:hypothetical protein P167DRAFT_250879 [Morchella conica CCBAS932]
MDGWMDLLYLGIILWHCYFLHRGHFGIFFFIYLFSFNTPKRLFVFLHSSLSVGLGRLGKLGEGGNHVAYEGACQKKDFVFLAVWALCFSWFFFFFSFFLSVVGAVVLGGGGGNGAPSKSFRF